jgi:SM-20-related protein
MDLRDAEIQALGEHGYFLRESFLGEAEARAVYPRPGEVDAGALRPAGIRRGADHRLDVATRGDSITWVGEEDARHGAGPALGSLRRTG